MGSTAFLPLLALRSRFSADSLPVAKETNVQAYLDRVEKVEAEASSLLAKTLKLEEQRQLLEFKNRVLTEMVSFMSLQENLAPL